MLKNLDRNSARFPIWNNAMDKCTSGKAKQSKRGSREFLPCDDVARK